jgi:hypothetical protein
VPNRWPNYSSVRFRSDRHAHEGARQGITGTIVEVYPDAYEVEVSDPATGETLFLGAFRDDDLELLVQADP